MGLQVKFVDAETGEVIVGSGLGDASTIKTISILDGIDEDGVKFNGNFKDEIFANYNCHVDMFHFYRNYQFVSPTNYLLSCDVSFDFPSIGRVFISRFDNILNKDGSLKLPQVNKTKDQLSISFVELFNKYLL